MIRPLVQRIRRYAELRAGLPSRVRKAVDDGVGIYNRTWPLGPTGREPARDARSLRPSAQVLSPQVLDWCRFAMGQMRRPYGLDHVSLVMAVIGRENRELAQANFGVLRPQEFYGEDGVAPRVGEVLAHWEEEGLLSAGGAGASRLAVLLFSWGDLTREMMLAG